MVPVPRERVGLAPMERFVRPLPSPVAPVAVPEPLPTLPPVRAPLNLAPIEPARNTSAVLPTLAPILQAVVASTGYPLAALRGVRRTAPIVKARQTACFVARRFTGRSLPSIGNALGRKDHTTVLYACRKVEAVVARIGEPEADTVGRKLPRPRGGLRSKRNHTFGFFAAYPKWGNAVPPPWTSDFLTLGGYAIFA